MYIINSLINSLLVNCFSDFLVFGTYGHQELHGIKSRHLLLCRVATLCCEWCINKSSHYYVYYYSYLLASTLISYYYYYYTTVTILDSSSSSSSSSRSSINIVLVCFVQCSTYYYSYSYSYYYYDYV